MRMIDILKRQPQRTGSPASCKDDENTPGNTTGHVRGHIARHADGPVVAPEDLYDEDWGDEPPVMGNGTTTAAPTNNNRNARRAAMAKRQPLRPRPGSAAGPVVAPEDLYGEEIEGLLHLMRDFIGEAAMRTRLAQDVAPDVDNINRQFPKIRRLLRATRANPTMRSLYDRLMKGLQDACDGMVMCVVVNLTDLTRVADDEGGVQWSPAQCIAAVLSSLLRLIRENALAPFSTTPRCFAQMSEDVYHDSKLRAAGLCLHRTRPVSQFTVADIMDMIFIIGVRWHKIRLRLSHFRRLLLALLYRALVIISAPQTAAVIDVPYLRAESSAAAPEGIIDEAAEKARAAEELLPCNGHAVRSLVVPFFKMLAAIYFHQGLTAIDGWTLCDGGGEDATKDDRIEEFREMAAALRRYMIKRMADVGNTPNSKTDVGRNFSRSIIKIGDVEQFYIHGKIGKPQARKVMMSSKLNGAQQAWHILYRFMRLDKMVEKMCEEDEDYFSKWTYYEHIYSLLTKSYLFEFPLVAQGQRFRGRYSMWGYDVIASLSQLQRETFPSVIEFMGRTLVIYNRKRYVVRSFEEAAVVWCLLLERDFRGQINNRSFVSDFNEMLGRGSHNTTVIRCNPWENKDVVEFDDDDDELVY